MPSPFQTENNFVKENCHIKVTLKIYNKFEKSLSLLCLVGLDHFYEYN